MGIQKCEINNVLIVKMADYDNIFRFSTFFHKTPIWVKTVQNMNIMFQL